MSNCIRWDDFERLRKGLLSKPQRVYVETHLRACGHCQEGYERFLVDEALPRSAPTAPAATVTELPEDTQSTDPAACSPPREHLPRIEGYTVLRWIGAGGMAVVYEAVQEKLARRVALKLLPAVAGAA